MVSVTAGDTNYTLIYVPPLSHNQLSFIQLGTMLHSYLQKCVVLEADADAAAGNRGAPSSCVRVRDTMSRDLPPTRHRSGARQTGPGCNV